MSLCPANMREPPEQLFCESSVNGINGGLTQFLGDFCIYLLCILSKDFFFLNFFNYSMFVVAVESKKDS